MSNSFLELVLATFAGAAVFHLVIEIYYEVKARILGRQYERFWDDLEEEIYE